MRRVGIVILGANGYMGHNAIGALPAVKGRLALHSIDLELIGLADPAYYNKKNEEALKKAHLDAIGAFGKMNPCVLFKDAEAAVAFFTDNDYLPFRSLQNMPEVIIVYDATPTNDRSALMSQVAQAERKSIHYLGEKPLVIDPAWMQKNQSIKDELRIFCDFIETSNPAVNILKETIANGSDGQGLTIRGMHFWRTGASGLKHLVGHNQKGVQGGAILDKAAHDISISTMLLEPSRIANFSITDAEIHALITQLKGDQRTHLNSRCELLDIGQISLEFKTRSSSRMLLPADGLSSLSVEWVLTSGLKVPANYLVGWLGYVGHQDHQQAHAKEKYFVDRLQHLGYPESLWLMREKHEGGNSGLSCVETQARIAIVDVTDSKGHESTLIANLIATEAKNGSHAIKRWVDWHHTEGERAVSRKLHGESDESYSALKQNDLSDVIYRVIMDCVDEREAKYLGARACYFVHCAMLEARDIALAKAKQQLDAGIWDFEIAERWIASAIMKK
jgi:predicted dehydrogenase